MHEWTCNKIEVLNGVTDIVETTTNKNTSLCDRGRERVLGLSWDTRDDTLGFNVGLNRLADDLNTGERISTKREFVRVIMSVFDPLGLLSTLTIKSKIIMQQIWRSGIAWDEKIYLGARG